VVQDHHEVVTCHCVVLKATKVSQSGRTARGGVGGQRQRRRRGGWGWMLRVFVQFVARVFKESSSDWWRGGRRRERGKGAKRLKRNKAGKFSHRVRVAIGLCRSSGDWLVWRDERLEEMDSPYNKLGLSLCPLFLCQAMRTTSQIGAHQQIQMVGL
jgi:hypothetical protein